MERLTERELMMCGNVDYKKCSSDNCFGYCGACDIDKEVGIKLKHYEDLEEQGLLLKLPCKLGDTVWCLEEDEYAGYLFLATSGEYFIVSAHYTHCDDINEQLEEMEEDTENWGYVSVGVFHKNKVFHTKEEAKAKLKEMEKEDD